MSLAATAARGRPRSAAADQAIVDATLALLADSGLDGLTMEGIAARAGVGKATLYRRYGTRDEVLQAALGHLNDDLPDALGLLEAHGLRTALVTMLDAIRARTPQTVQGRILLRVMAEQSTRPALHALVIDRVIEPRTRRMRAMLAAAVERGELRADVDIEAIVPLLVGPALYLGMRGGAVSMAAVVDAVLDGLSARRTPARPAPASRS